ncbi:DUF2523 family protein [Dyella subtropica]|uniref:DUF2523 family protein n=1 Tax=Dyella subtropica TaxID=2992127 RepID=UPI00224F2240|nr:DUF2523 family protein [Dyella subtropica]
MPAIIAWLVGVLESRIGSIVISALLSLGFSFTTYKFAVGPFRDLIRGILGGAPSYYLGIIGFTGMDACVTMVLSAIAARYAVSSVSNLVRNKKAA